MHCLTGVPRVFISGGSHINVESLAACNVVDGRYKYLADLLSLDQCRPAARSDATSYDDSMRKSESTINVPRWEACLSSHPDRVFANLIVRGLEEGFHIGFDYSSRECRSAKRNMRSAKELPGPITSYLHTERQMRRVVDPPIGTKKLQINPFGIIPKPHQPGKWRLILNLSSPRGASVNDGIDPDLCSISYVRIDQAAKRALDMGHGALMAKLDLRNAYRIVPVHEDDRHLLGMKWKGAVCLDAALPFGLRSAPKIFSAVADALLWIMYDRGLTSGIHYLDDFLVLGPPGSDECANNLEVALDTCRILGVPVAPHKLVNPTTKLTFLGIEIDTILGLLRLPADKLTRLRGMLTEWSKRRGCTKRELLSLIGSLHHAATVVKPGRIFLRRLIDLSKVPKALHHFVRLNSEARSDIQWWQAFACRWNGVGLLSALGQSTPSVWIRSDASGGWGCGAFCGDAWLQLQWAGELSGLGIAAKEAIPVVLAAFTWGYQWQGQHVVFEVDNSTVVAALRSGSCRDAEVMRLLRLLHFAAAELQFTFTSVHIPGSSNVVADALSRNQLSVAVSVCPQLQPNSCHIPEPLIRLLQSFDLDWTSDAWRTQFLASLQRA